MSPRIKTTQFEFEMISIPSKRKYYGDLALMYDVFVSLTDYRKKKRLTQKELAEASGIDRTIIARIEAGRANPTLSQLVKLGRALSIVIKFEEKQLLPPSEDQD